MANLNEYSDEQLVEGLRTNDSKVFNFLYARYLPWAYKHVTSNSGTREDAEDLFTKLLLAIKKNIVEDRYEQRNFEGYLKEVGRRLWLKELRKMGLLRAKKDEEAIATQQELHYEEEKTDTHRVVAFDDYKHDRADEDELEEDQPNYKLVQLMLQAMKEKLDESCQELLTKRYFANIPLMEVADSLGWTYQYSRVKVVRCKDRLKKLVMEDPTFLNIIKK